MTAEGGDRRLSDISTVWSAVRRVHGTSPEERAAAQRLLIQQYGGAVQRYLVGALRDPDAADELSQEFALRLIRGDFRGADPACGRFRDFVKGILFHLIADHHRKKRKTPMPMDVGALNLLTGSAAADEEQAFREQWREQLLARAWEALAQDERTTGRPNFTILRYRADYPDLRAEALTEGLAQCLSKPLTDSAARQALHRARSKFGDLLMREVLQTLADATVDSLEQELIDLGLLDPCRAALARLRGQEE
jgi:DNA-directed RNA polymerase specialized sigma24 family protein